MHPREGLVHAKEATDLMGEEVLRDAGGAGGGSLGELPPGADSKGLACQVVGFRLYRWGIDVGFF